jgi:hypothetical protein
VIDECKPGKKIVDVCVFGDKLVDEMLSHVYGKGKIEKGSAFPTCISVNACVGHFSPLLDNTTQLQEGDVAKMYVRRVFFFFFLSISLFFLSYFATPSEGICEERNTKEEREKKRTSSRLTRIADSLFPANSVSTSMGTLLLLLTRLFARNKQLSPPLAEKLM